MTYKNVELIQLDYNTLIDCVGTPVLTITPVDLAEHVYTAGEEVSVFSERMGDSYKWIIFDGTVELSPETKDRTYWTLKEFV